jgi:tetratricopeptide (TPR) repeat protein
MAFTRLNKMQEAKLELTKLKTLVDDPFMEMTISGFNSFRKILTIAHNVLEAEIEADQGNYERSIDLFNNAIAIEDNLLYQEPPDWFLPVRQSLGAVLLEANQPQLAEIRFREDLKQYRNNGWSLYGLYRSLELQGKQKEAREIKRLFETAFANADVKLTSSRF